MRANPQLESLHIYGDVDEQLIRSIEEYSQQLINLYLWPWNDEVFYEFDDESVKFESVEKFTFHGQTCMIPFEFKNLQEVHLDGFFALEDIGFGTELLSFLGRNKNLIKLNLNLDEEAWEEIELDDIATAIKSLSNLIALQFRADVFEANELIQFMSKINRLKTIRLAFSEPDSHQSVREAMKPLKFQWKIKARKDWKYRYIDFERK